MLNEKPDPVGVTLLIGLALWSGVGLVVAAALHYALRSQIPPVTFTAALGTYNGCSSSLYANDDASDSVQDVLATPSACTTGSSEPMALLHAYLTGAELPVVHAAPRPAVDNALRARGAALFADHCAGCHGTTGSGSGPDACALAIPPAALATGIYALRTTEHESLPTDDDIFTTISRGVHGTAMPPWFALAESDRWALVEHVKTLSKAFSEDTAAPPVAIDGAPAATPARIAHGHMLFEERGCASCHGARGLGDGPAAFALPVRPRNFVAGRLHRGSRLSDIHTTLVTGLDGTPMPSFDKVMTADELWDVALFIETLVPRQVEHGALRCPEHPTNDYQERFGVRAVLRAVPSLNHSH